MNISQSTLAPEDLVSRDRFGLPVPRPPANSLTLRLNLVLLLAGFLLISASFSSGQLPTDAFHESTDTGPVVLTVLSTCPLDISVQLTTSRIANLTRLIHTFAICMTIHTYIVAGTFNMPTSYQ